MNSVVRTVYEQYCDYVTRLHVNLDRHVDATMSRKYRVEMLKYDDFCLLWRRLGNCEGQQETWRRRFELGYDEYIEGLSDRLKRAPTHGHPSKPVACARDAA